MELTTKKGGEQGEDQQGRAGLSSGFDSQAGLSPQQCHGRPPTSAPGADHRQLPSSSGRDTFDAFAAFYDHYTAGYQASTWTASLEELLEACGLPGKRLLDVGCGTGKSFLPMLERGWEAVGCDVSPAMIEVAREKAGDAARLEVADVRELPVYGEFDCVWALNDTLNYLLSPEELVAALAGMRRNLAPGGLVLFDLNTLLLHRWIFASQSATREEAGHMMSWIGQETGEIGPGSLCEARFEVEGEPAAGHVHRQRHFPEAEVLAAIERAGLESLRVWGDYEGKQDRPLDEERHQKAIYICRGRP